LVYGCVDVSLLDRRPIVHERLIVFPRSAFALGKHPENLVGVDEAQCICFGQISPVAAPWIFAETLRNLRAIRIMMDVFEQGQKVSVAIAKNGFVPALEEVPHSLVPAIIVHGVALVDPLEDFGESDVFCFDQQVNVVGHEYVRIEIKMVSLLVAGKYVEELLIVERIFEYLQPLVASCDNVIKGAFVFNPRFSCHGIRIANIPEGVNNSIFKSDPIYTIYIFSRM
jgi:hypothetical protein